MILYAYGDIRATVHRSLDDASIVSVFPTETAVRFWTNEYVKTSEKGILRHDRIMAWDTFRSHFLPTGTSAPANGFIRHLFALHFLGDPDTAASLQWFRHPSFPESVGNLASAVVSLLPKLQDIERMRLVKGESYDRLPLAYRNDAARLQAAYSDFLTKRNLFEPRYLLPSVGNLPSGFERNYRVFFPEVCDGWEEFTRMPHFPTWIETCSADASKTENTLHMYENELMELRACLHDIEQLLDHGQDFADIVVTVGNMERWRPYLEHEARLCDIPLTIVEGLSPLQYPPGRFFQSIQDVHAQSYSLEAMKSFLLDPRMPWKHAEVHRDLILRGLELSVVQGNPNPRKDDWQVKLARTQLNTDTRLLNWYQGFKIRISSVVAAKDTESLMQAVYVLQEFLLESGSWRETDGGDLHSSVYAYCLNQLSELGKAVRSCGFTNTQALLSLFVQFLGKQQYIPKDRTPGIPVFSYTVSVGLCPRYHFLLGCTQEDTEQSIDQLPLIPEPIWRDDAANDRTGMFLDHYRVMAQEVHTSAAHATFGNSSALAPTWFVDHDAIEMQRYVPADARTREQIAWAAGTGTFPFTANTMQSRWFDQACHTAFVPPRFDMADDKTVFSVWDRSCKGSGHLALSATALDMFFDCPMKWASSYLMHLHKGMFDPVSLDHAAVGVLLHEIMALFFQRVRDASGVFRKELTDRYEVLLTTSIDEVFNRFAHSPHAPVHTTVHYIAERYRTELMAILKAEGEWFDGFSSWGFEVSLEQLYAQSDCLLNGRIDRILVQDHADGTQTVAVVDYKKTYRGSGKAYDNFAQGLPSHQLPLYAKLIRDTDSTGVRQVGIAAFYSIENGKYIPIWEESQEDRRDGMIAVLEEHLLHMVGALRQGRLGATPSKQACANCDYRQICRRRYALV